VTFGVGAGIFLSTTISLRATDWPPVGVKVVVSRTLIARRRSPSHVR